jgi:8-oxo-dGTP diphosphatase
VPEELEARHGRGREVRAAGGVVVRGTGADVRVALIHRPKYGDWTLPKGKLEPGEGWEEAALREVEEETGQRCELARELEPARYRDRKGRPKLVRYWLMRSLGGEFSPGEEVDELRWAAPAAATRLLSYEHDRRLVDAAVGTRTDVEARTPRSGKGRPAPREG